jgi:hypothetical protein
VGALSALAGTDSCSKGVTAIRGMDADESDWGFAFVVGGAGS